MLMPIDEVRRYFETNDSRMCKLTKAAVKKGSNKDDSGMCYWWLRTPGAYSSYAAIVDYDGSINDRGLSADSDIGAVRPVIALRLS